MTVRERVLEARLLEKINRNPAFAKQIGIELEQQNRNRQLNDEKRSADTRK